MCYIRVIFLLRKGVIVDDDLEKAGKCIYKHLPTDKSQPILSTRVFKSGKNDLYFVLLSLKSLF